MEGMGSAEVVKDALNGDRTRRVRRRALLGAAVLALLAFWWSDWDWWPGVVWAGVPMLLVMLPGIRKLVDEEWGLLAGLLLFALQLLPQLDGAQVAMAWGAAALVVAAATFRRGRHGWRAWAPWVAAGLALVTFGIGFAVWWSGQAERDADQARQAQEAHRYNVSKLLPTSPREAVFALVEGVAQTERADRVCTVFSPVAAASFAVAHRAADCEGALAVLRAQIKDWSAYVNQLWIPTQEQEKNPPKAGMPRQLDACHLEFGNVLAGDHPDAGPQLGVLTFEQQYGNGWLIIAYEPCR